MRRKYSKSGAMLPKISPVIENHRRESLLKGSAIAGCANVNGMLP